MGKDYNHDESRSAALTKPTCSLLICIMSTRHVHARLDPSRKGRSSGGSTPRPLERPQQLCPSKLQRDIGLSILYFWYRGCGKGELCRGWNAAESAHPLSCNPSSHSDRRDFQSTERGNGWSNLVPSFQISHAHLFRLACDLNTPLPIRDVVPDHSR